MLPWLLGIPGREAGGDGLFLELYNLGNCINHGDFGQGANVISLRPLPPEGGFSGNEHVYRARRD